jgi:hypothetical protein
MYETAAMRAVARTKLAHEHAKHGGAVTSYFPGSYFAYYMIDSVTSLLSEPWLEPVPWF